MLKGRVQYKRREKGRIAVGRVDFNRDQNTLQIMVLQVTFAQRPNRDNLDDGSQKQQISLDYLYSSKALFLKEMIHNIFTIKTYLSKYSDRLPKRSISPIITGVNSEGSQFACLISSINLYHHKTRISKQVAAID